MPVEWFLNERSLHAQYGSDEQVVQAVVRFLALWRKIPDDDRLRSELFVCSEARAGEDLRATLKRLPRELQEAAIQWLFDKKSPRPWQPERISRADEQWICRSIDVGGTSMSEAAARRLQDRTVALLNFQGSFLADLTEARISRVDDVDVVVASFDDVAALEAWVRTLSSVPEYTHEARDPPQDAQTCLVEIIRFEPLSLFVQARRVYRERSTGRFFYVDNLHWGGAAELEVYHRNGVRHEGTADLQGRLRPSTRDRSKDGRLRS